MENIVRYINSVLWGVPVLSLILLTGVYLSVSSGFAQIRLLPLATRKFVNSFRRTNSQKQGISGYRALCMALSATVGTGNIAGVAGSIAIGGPGTIFWMWLCAILGMITKLAEVTLAQCHRVRNKSGEYVGGPMYIIQSALPRRYVFLGAAYAFLGVVAALGVGNATQVNTVVESLKSMANTVNFELEFHGRLIIGGILIILIIQAFRSGTNGIGCWVEKLVPFASGVYILMCLAALYICRRQVIPAICSILTGAFNPRSVTCGAIGSAFLTLRVGASRGVFTNEAGMGTASIVHAAAEVDHPLEQGLMGIIEVFLDTIIICTMTALVILSSNVEIPYDTDPGIALTLDAFSLVLGEWSRLVITGLTCILAFATILGWGVYGMRCAQYLLGDSVWKTYLVFQVCAVMLGVIVRTSVVWSLAEIVNGLMAIPNLIMLFMLSRTFLNQLKEFQKRKRTV